MKVTLAPAKLPFCSSMYIWKPFSMSLPIWAKMPVIGARKPIFNSCEKPGLAATKPAMSTAKRFMPFLL